MNQRDISIRGASEHNLKSIDVDIPRESFTVVTGLSGSGKSSLAFDTLYAEGRRRFVESLSAYARRFLGQMEKPDVERMDGLSPTIAIEQKNRSGNPRSTVGTVTEIHDYLRLFYARVGDVFCPDCGNPIEATSVENMVERIMQREAGERILVLSPVVRGRKGEYQELFEDLKREGFPRVRVDGETVRLDREDPPNLERDVKHTVEVVVDRLKIQPDEQMKSRLTDSVELAVDQSDGIVVIEDYDSGETVTLSEQFACSECGYSFTEVEPRSFSFNSPYGACEVCEGLGQDKRVDPDLIFDEDLSLSEGALRPFSSSSSDWFRSQIESLAGEYEIDLTVPVRELSEQDRRILLYGSDEPVDFHFSSREGAYSFEGEFEGAIPIVWKRHKRSSRRRVRQAMENYMSSVPCPACDGTRLSPEALSVTVQDKNIAEVSRMDLDDCRRFFRQVELSGMDARIGEPILREIDQRLSFLEDVGLEYLSLDRRAQSLSGGEAQRIQLATQIGSRLVGVTYVLDEPTIGLHSRDNNRLLETLKDLRDLGNTIVVVEHDPDTIRASDYLLDLGPEAGADGGHVVFEGTYDELIADGEGYTADYMRGDRTIDIPADRRTWDERLTLRGARGHNLKDIDVEFPLEVFTCLTGVSGSGKSTLLYETLYRRIHQEFHKSQDRPLDHDRLEGLDKIDKLVNVDQSPIGRTPRSNAATYTGFFTPIRELYASLPEANVRGFDKGRFSFNVKGGRCENCGGAGEVEIEMHFLPDVYVTCDECDGKRYNEETLKVRYRGKTIADVLDMSVSEALDFFRDHRRIERRLQTLYDVGLGYLTLGQPATTLSGGEAQRVKLASELSKVQTGDTLYLLDEPTTGLHKEDIRQLLDVLHMLVDRGNTVIVIEHNLDVVKNADWIIDLGPEGGEAGGTVVAEGTPEDLLDDETSYTGQSLTSVLPGKPAPVG